MIIPVVITDGRREFIEPTIKSVFENVHGLSLPGVMVNDCGEDLSYDDWLREKFGANFIRINHLRRRGLAAGIRSGWEMAIRKPEVTHVWHQEDDYVIPQTVELGPLVEAMESEPMLAELTLKRNPYSREEHAAGDYMASNPEPYSDTETPNGFKYVRHDRIFHSQPSLIPRRVVELVLEHRVALTEPGLRDILVGAGYHFGVIGQMADAPLVEHIGTRRSERWGA